MRLDAHKGDTGWYVFHVPTARVVPFVVWVDDETCEYCTVEPLGPSFSFSFRVNKAKRIAIYVARKLVLIDPVDDDPSCYFDVEPKELVHVG